MTSNRLRVGSALLTLALASGGAASAAAQTELKVGYMKHPIHEASVAMMEKWAAENDVKLTKIPMAYDVFQEKVTATLTSGGDQFDIIWHNDDWGQLWEKWVEPTDDIPDMDSVDPHPLDAFYNDDGKVTVVPMAHTVGTFFYRTDLVSEDEVPTTFDELVATSKRLQEEGKAKWGYVGGMKMNHTWFTFWWTMWNNHCDLFEPIYERDNEVLEENGWTPAIDRALPPADRRVLVGRDQRAQDQPARHDHLRPRRGQRDLHGRRRRVHRGRIRRTLATSTIPISRASLATSRWRRCRTAPMPTHPSPGTRSGAGRSPRACRTSASRPPRRCSAPCCRTSTVR